MKSIVLKQTIKVFSWFFVLPFVIWLLASIFLLNLAPYLIYGTQPYFEFPTYISHSRKLIQSPTGKLEIIEMEGQKKDTYIMYFHGNGGYSYGLAHELRQFGNVISAVYPGYQRSEGFPSTESINSSSQVVYEYLKSQGIKDENITIFGHSLGGSPALYLASRQPKVSKLILVNTFSSVYSMCRHIFLILCGGGKDFHPSVEYARLVTVPVFLFHAPDDETIPFREGEKLFAELATNRKTFIELAGSHSVFSVQTIFEQVK
jgi:esterase/lipase